MPSKTKNEFDEALKFAIDNEQKAVEFYTKLAARPHQPGVKEMLLQLAEEEKGHKAKLERVRSGEKLLKPGAGLTRKLDLEDYVTAPESEDDLDFQDALLLAMKKEKAAFSFYMDVAGNMRDPSLKELFLSLASEEATHKLRFELEYDRQIQPDN
ncbi:MAG: ferritin family protein [Elusimicrobiota bacterium]|jgi:rubrerythrin